MMLRVCLLSIFIRSLKNICVFMSACITWSLNELSCSVYCISSSTPMFMRKLFRFTLVVTSSMLTSAALRRFSCMSWPIIAEMMPSSIYFFRFTGSNCFFPFSRSSHVSEFRLLPREFSVISRSRTFMSSRYSFFDKGCPFFLLFAIESKLSPSKSSYF